MLVEKPFPEATSCVLLGPVDQAVDFRRYRNVLWCAEREDRGPALAHVQRLCVEQTTPATFATTLEKFIRLNPRRLPSLFVSDDVLVRRAADYEQLIAEAYAQLESHHRARTTRQKDGFAWQKHVLANLSAYAGARLPASWAGALRGLPAVVCGAGPSLDVSAPALRKYADEAVIFGGDSSLRALARHGVRADFVVSIDVAKIPEKCLPAEAGFRPGRIVLSPLSPPAWHEGARPGEAVFVGGTQLTLDWLATHGIAQPPLLAAENCGRTALELARFLGCGPIHLFGLDLALDAANPGRRHHGGVESALYANSNFNAAQEFPLVPGNCAEKVPTHIYGDWRSLDEALAAWPAGLVCNVTDRGARLRNTTVIAPEAFALPPLAGGKAVALARLPASGSAAEPESCTAAPFGPFARLRAVGDRAQAAVHRLHATLEASGPVAAADALREFFLAPDVGHVFGGFSLKLMPHLVPPVEGDAAFWRTAIDEFGTLAEAASRAGP